LPTILSSILTSGIVAGLLVFVVRTYISQRIKNEYDMKLETHKAELKAQNEVEIERLRSSLTAMANEKQIRFSSFHDKLKEIVPKTYALIQEHRHAVREYTKPILGEDAPPLPERRQEVDKCIKEFWDHFYPNELYFPENVAQEIRSLNDLSREVCNSFWQAHESDWRKSAPLEEYRNLLEQYKSLLREEEELFIKIRRQFQELVGVPPTDGESMR
jgi:hypothetical protein